MAKETIASLESLSILFYELHQKSLLEMENQKVMDTTLKFHIFDYAQDAKIISIGQLAATLTMRIKKIFLSDSTTIHRTLYADK